MYDAAIKSLWGPQITGDMVEYNEAMKKFQDQVKNFKHGTLTRMQAFVEEMIEANASILTLPEAGLQIKFESVFSPENFCRVHYYMEKYVDLDKSHKNGVKFAKTTFAQLAIEVMAFVKVLRDKATKKDGTARDRLTAAFAAIPNYPAFKRIRRDKHFVEKTSRSLGRKKEKQGRDLSVLSRMNVEMEYSSEEEEESDALLQNTFGRFGRPPPPPPPNFNHYWSLDQYSQTSTLA
ncbi:unnamed protein product [Zymoseptoria tritici ST99CH_1A5]|uniref:Uncharacterized protein n=1 Tax=Zymoseptoria tritici ST99CH_1A5 TaxID=1276529 RepID=A0A1Y6M180_ZYMTR|nr:unnamed protein product [Zymoseptoria tritici ST99CH_1A5]